jgi:hypothetical protein
MTITPWDPQPSREFLGWELRKHRIRAFYQTIAGDPDPAIRAAIWEKTGIRSKQTDEN